MPFTEEQTQSLPAVKGIGKTVLQRLRQMGLDDVAKLAAADADSVLRYGTDRLNLLEKQPAGQNRRKRRNPMGTPKPFRRPSKPNQAV